MPWGKFPCRPTHSWNAAEPARRQGIFKFNTLLIFLLRLWMSVFLPLYRKEPQWVIPLLFVWQMVAVDRGDMLERMPNRDSKQHLWNNSNEIESLIWNFKIKIIYLMFDPTEHWPRSSSNTRAFSKIGSTSGSLSGSKSPRRAEIKTCKKRFHCIIQKLTKFSKSKTTSVPRFFTFSDRELIKNSPNDVIRKRLRQTTGHSSYSFCTRPP